MLQEDEGLEMAIGLINVKMTANPDRGAFTVAMAVMV